LKEEVSKKKENEREKSRRARNLSRVRNLIARLQLLAPLGSCFCPRRGEHYGRADPSACRSEPGEERKAVKMTVAKGGGDD